MNDAEALEPLDGLGSEHGRAVVGQERSRKTTFLERLRQCVNEGLGGLVEVPLQVATEAGAVVEDAEELRLLPLPRGSEDGARALVKVQVPEAVDVRDLVRACLSRREGLAIRRLAMASLAGTRQALRLHESAHRRVPG